MRFEALPGPYRNNTAFLRPLVLPMLRPYDEATPFQRRMRVLLFTTPIPLTPLLLHT